MVNKNVTQKNAKAIHGFLVTNIFSSIWPRTDVACTFPRSGQNSRSFPFCCKGVQGFFNQFETPSFFDVWVSGWVSKGMMKTIGPHNAIDPDHESYITKAGTNDSRNANSFVLFSQRRSAARSRKKRTNRTEKISASFLTKGITIPPVPNASPIMRLAIIDFPLVLNFNAP